jgi:hypothetical protein
VRQRVRDLLAWADPVLHTPVGMSVSGHGRSGPRSAAAPGPSSPAGP